MKEDFNTKQKYQQKERKNYITSKATLSQKVGVNG